jgi:SAM-dependent methyltransferase
MLLLAHVVAFLAAYFLFQVELVVAKAVLPGFGGSYLVWSISVVFFQIALLAGYWYASAVTRLGGVRRYFAVHLGLLLVPLFTFPVSLSIFAGPRYGMPVPLEIMAMLAQSIGAGFVLLSSMAVMVQNLVAASDSPQRENPYVLYATSNLGSFAGLAAYPLLVEPNLDLGDQFTLWQWGYAALVVLHLALGWFVFRLPARPGGDRDAARAVPPPPGRGRVQWLLLSAAGAAMFLAATNVITMDLASVPLLWTVPLCLYLLSFVLAFKRRPWYPEWVRSRFTLAVAVGMFLFLLMLQSYKLPPLALVAAHLLVMFLVCLVCHAELHRRRPDEARLPGFYVLLSLGGVLGGFLVSWVVPLVSTSTVEYLVALFLAGFALSWDSGEPRPTWRTALRAAGLFALTVAWPLALYVAGEGLGSVVAIGAGLTLAGLLYGLERRPLETALAVAAVIVGVQVINHAQLDRTYVYKHRNYYGIYRVYDKGPKRILMHGTTLHGSQYLAPARQGEALSYYHATAPGGELLASPLGRGRVGIVGLGAGALSVYARPGQPYDFYELDPDNEAVATEYFTYLDRSAGRVRLIFGDARLSVEPVADDAYDVFVLDAFSSDAIPVHLITVEALAEYLRITRPRGVVLLHLSNKYLDLLPVAYAGARELGAHILHKPYAGEGVHPDAQACVWAAVTASQRTAGLLQRGLGWQDLRQSPPRPVRPWTDRFSNILSALD